MRLRFIVIVAAIAASVAPARAATTYVRLEGTWTSTTAAPASCEAVTGVCRDGVLFDENGARVATFTFGLDVIWPGTTQFQVWGREVDTYPDGSTMLSDVHGTLRPEIDGVKVDVDLAIVGGTGRYAGFDGYVDVAGTLDPATDRATGTYRGFVYPSTVGGCGPDGSPVNGSGSCETAANQVRCGRKNGLEQRAMVKLQAGANGVEGCRDTPVLPNGYAVEGRAGAQTDCGCAYVDGDADNHAERRLTMWLRVDGDGVWCGSPTRPGDQSYSGQGGPFPGCTS